MSTGLHEPVGSPPREPQAAPCPRCGGTDRIPYEIKPPTGHTGPCTPACTITVMFCLHCRFAA